MDKLPTLEEENAYAEACNMLNEVVPKSNKETDEQDPYLLACNMLEDTETTLEMKRKIDRQTKNLADPDSETDNEPDSVELIQDKHVTIFTVTNLFTNEQEVKIDDWPAADILVLAGNTGEPIKSFDKLHDFLLACKTKYQHVIMIAGILEFTRALPNYSILFDKLKELEAKTLVHVVTNSVLDIMGCKFICAPLWPVPDIGIYMGEWKEIFGSRVNQISSSVEDYKFICQNLLQILEGRESNTTNLDLHPPVIICTAYSPTSQLYPDLPLTDKATFTLDCLKEMEKINAAEYWFCGNSLDYRTSHKHLDCTVITNAYMHQYSNQVDKQVYTVKTTSKWQNYKPEEKEPKCPIQ